MIALVSGSGDTQTHTHRMSAAGYDGDYVFWSKISKCGKSDGFDSGGIFKFFLIFTMKLINVE
jgi:hypothetical protein